MQLNSGSSVADVDSTTSNKKIFQCNFTGCGKKFHFSYHLKRHKVGHSSIKPFACPTCGACFNRRDNQIQHMRRVHGDQQALTHRRPPSGAVTPTLRSLTTPLVSMSIERQYQSLARSFALALPQDTHVPTANEYLLEGTDNQLGYTRGRLLFEVEEAGVDQRRHGGSSSGGGQRSASVVAGEEGGEEKVEHDELEELPVEVNPCKSKPWSELSPSRPMARPTATPQKDNNVTVLPSNIVCTHICQKCGEILNTSAELKQHTALRHSNRISAPPVPQKLAPSPHKFPAISPGIASGAKFPEHGRFQCQWGGCGQIFLKRNIFKLHVLAHATEAPSLPLLSPTTGHRPAEPLLTDALPTVPPTSPHYEPTPVVASVGVASAPGLVNGPVAGPQCYRCKWPNCTAAFDLLSQFERHRQVHVQADKNNDALTTVAAACPPVRTEKPSYPRHNHTDVGYRTRRFVCDWPACGKFFGYFVHLQRHHRTHSGERPYVCAICRTGFNRKDNVRGHIKSKHPTVVYTDDLLLVMQKAPDLPYHIESNTASSRKSVSKISTSFRRPPASTVDHIEAGTIGEVSDKQEGVGRTERPESEVPARVYTLEPSPLCDKDTVEMDTHEELGDQLAAEIQTDTATFATSAYQSPSELRLSPDAVQSDASGLVIKTELPSSEAGEEEDDIELNLVLPTSEFGPTPLELGPGTSHPKAATSTLKRLHKEVVQSTQRANEDKELAVDLSLPGDAGSSHNNSERHLLSEESSVKSNGMQDGLVCQRCGEMFEQYLLLEIHRQLHVEDDLKRSSVSITADAIDGENIIDNTCPVCGKRFVNNYRLKRHLSTHTGEKPFKCDRCPTRFVNKANLETHERMRHGDLSSPRAAPSGVPNKNCFPCPHPSCGKKFPYSSQLTRHLVVHKLGKPHQCETCQGLFVQQSSLYRHIRERHTPNGTNGRSAPFTCGGCHRAYYTNSELTRHEMSHVEVASKKPPASSAVAKNTHSPQKARLESVERHTVGHSNVGGPPSVAQPQPTSGRTSVMGTKDAPAIGATTSRSVNPAAIQNSVNVKPAAAQNSAKTKASLSAATFKRSSRSNLHRCAVCNAAFLNPALLVKHRRVSHPPPEASQEVAVDIKCERSELGNS